MTARIECDPGDFRVTGRENLFAQVRAVREGIESGFREKIERPLFKLSGVIKIGITKEEVVVQTREFIRDIIEAYGQDIANFPKEVFRGLSPIFAERPIPELIQRKVFVKDRLNLIAARIMARIGMDTKHIALELGKDWETVYNWTRDIKENFQNSKREMVRELVKKGVAVYKVVRMLHVGYRTATHWCRDILEQFEERGRNTLQRERELATLGFWPSTIAQQSGLNRSTVLRHVRGYWLGRRVEIEQERKDRGEAIRAMIKEGRQKGVKMTKLGLARQLGIDRKTLDKDLLRLGMSLKS